MAFSTLSASANAQSKTASTSIVSGNITATSGKLIVVHVAKDNVQTTDGQTSEVTSVTDPQSNVYTKLGEFCNGQGAGNGGATVSVWASVLTTGLTAQAITANLSSSITAKAIGVSVFGIGSGSSFTVASLQTRADDAADPGSMTISGLSNQEYLFIRGIAAEAVAGSITRTTNYGESFTPTSTSGGSGATNIGVGGEFRILTGTGDTSDPTFTTADCASVYIALKEVTPGAIIGSTSSTFTPSASLDGSGALAALSSNKFTPTGVLGGSGALAGAITAIFSPTATLTSIAAGSIVGSTTVTFSPSAALSGTANLAGTSANTFTASGVLKGAGTLAGTSLVTFTPSASMAGSEALAGLSSNVFTPSASLTGAGRLIGSAANLFTVSGALTGSGSLAALSSNIFSATATLTSLGSGAISGLSSALFSGSASLSGDGALAGASNLFFTASGTLIDISAPIQPAQVTEQPAGRSRKRKQRFIARFKGKDHFFRSIDGLEAFVKSVTKPAELKQAKPPVKIIVPASIDDEMAEYDLPSLQPILSKFDWTKAKAVIERANSIIEGVEKRMAMDMEDEELLLL